jgi:hypothetical protein
MKTPATTEQSSVVDLNFGLVKVASAPCAVKVKPFGFLAKTFFLSTESFVIEDGKKLFAGNLDTSPPDRFGLYLSQS